MAEYLLTLIVSSSIERARNLELLFKLFWRVGWTHFHASGEALKLLSSWLACWIYGIKVSKSFIWVYNIYPTIISSAFLIITKSVLEMKVEIRQVMIEDTYLISITTSIEHTDKNIKGLHPVIIEGSGPVVEDLQLFIEIHVVCCRL